MFSCSAASSFCTKRNVDPSFRAGEGVVEGRKDDMLNGESCSFVFNLFVKRLVIFISCCIKRYVKFVVDSFLFERKSREEGRCVCVWLYVRAYTVKLCRRRVRDDGDETSEEASRLNFYCYSYAVFLSIWSTVEDG